MAIATDLLDQVPQPFNLEEVMKAKADDPSALHVVLFQVGADWGRLVHTLPQGQSVLSFPVTQASRGPRHGLPL